MEQIMVGNLMFGIGIDDDDRICLAILGLPTVTEGSTVKLYFDPDEAINTGQRLIDYANQQKDRNKNPSAAYDAIADIVRGKG